MRNGAAKACPSSSRWVGVNERKVTRGAREGIHLPLRNGVPMGVHRRRTDTRAKFIQGDEAAF